jgi:hypothetical protein
MNASLLMKRLDSTVYQEINIIVSDISRTGLGFYCKSPLKVGSVYEARLMIAPGEYLHCFPRIIRAKPEADTVYYGSYFIGMTEMDAAKISVYQAIMDNHPETINNVVV